MRLVLALCLLLPCLSHAQVYKCTGRSGEPVYSQEPCRSDAQPHVLRNGQVAGADLRVDARCLEQARAGIYAAANDRAATFNQRLAQMRANGAAGADLARIERERTEQYAHANAQLREARRQCLRPAAPAAGEDSAEPAPEQRPGQADS